MNRRSIGVGFWGKVSVMLAFGVILAGAAEAQPDPSKHQPACRFAEDSDFNFERLSDADKRALIDTKAACLRAGESEGWLTWEVLMRPDKRGLVYRPYREVDEPSAVSSYRDSPWYSAR